MESAQQLPALLGAMNKREQSSHADAAFEGRALTVG
jgi:hypothetical protein